MERSAILFFTTLMVLTTGVQSQLMFAINSMVNITRTGCGSTKLCVEQQNGCDPAGNSACLFVSTALKNQTANGAEVSFQLSGNSTGYIAAGITPNASMGSTLLFVCTNNITINEKFFWTVLRNNTDETLSPHNQTNVREIRGRVNGNKIQCEFDVPNLNATSSSFLRAGADTTFFILLGTGELNSDGSPKTFNRTFTSNALDLTNPMANVANTTAVPTNTTGAADRALHSGGALLLMSVLSLSALTAA